MPSNQETRNDNGTAKCSKHSIRLLWPKKRSLDLTKLMHISSQVFMARVESRNPDTCPALTTLFFLYKNIVFPAQAEYSYFSANVRLKIFS